MSNSSKLSTRDTYRKLPADSTDKILDEIDAKLHGVTSSCTYQYSQKADVNDEPGTDLQSIQNLRRHMDFNNSTRYHSSKLPDVPTNYDDRNGSSIKIEYDRRTNLHQNYDDDINLLRRMLKENSDEVKTVEEVREPTANESTFVEIEDKPTQQTVRWADIEAGKENENHRVEPSIVEEQQNSASISAGADEDATCFCGCEEELIQMTKERDELKARIRRGEASRTSIEERQELERALHTTKTALFQQRKKSRQQLEDIEEKLEEAQHYYDEKLLEKDEVIESLRMKIDPQKTNLPSDQPRPDFENDLKDKEIEIKQLTDLSSRQQHQIDELKSKLTDEVKRVEDLARQTLASESAKWEGQLKEIQTKSDKEKQDHRNDIKDLEEEKDSMYADVLDLTKKLQDFHKQIELKESQIKEENCKKENDYKATNELLKNKIESLKEELSLSFAKNSEIELEMRRKESELRQDHKSREGLLREENLKLEDDLANMQSEVTQAISKLKHFKADIDHQDQLLAASINDECHKLMLLLHAMQPVSNKMQNAYTSKSQATCKKSVSELQENVEMVCRSANEMICEVTRLKRESRKRPDYYSLRNNSDISIASEEVKILRERLGEKENELQHLQLNMNQWKDLTSQRLAEKFQEELQLQVDKKLLQFRGDNSWKPQQGQTQLGRFSKSTNNVNSNSTVQHNETSTVKLLCHLQGRVKQLRTENDLLRSSSFIKGLDGI